MTSRVIVLIPAYNEAATIGAVIERLLTIPLPADRQIIVVNGIGHVCRVVRLQNVLDPPLGAIEHAIAVLTGQPAAGFHITPATMPATNARHPTTGRLSAHVSRPAIHQARGSNTRLGECGVSVNP